MSIQAIRIEHPSDGQGIFTSINKTTGLPREVELLGDYLPEVEKRHQYFPSLWEDKTDYTKDDFCAYKNLDQLNKWIFKEEIKQIIEKGFKIYILDLSEAILTDYQVIYKKENIEQQKDITCIFQ